MMEKALSELIEQYERPKSFSHAAFTPKMHERVGVELGLSLLEQYLAFIERYGHGGLDGFEILGIGLDGSIIFPEETLEYRELGLSENCDEWLRCIDCNNGKIVYWGIGGEVTPSFPSFDGFLMDCVENVIDNM